MLKVTYSTSRVDHPRSLVVNPRVLAQKTPGLSCAFLPVGVSMCQARELTKSCPMQFAIADIALVGLPRTRAHLGISPNRGTPFITQIE